MQRSLSKQTKKRFATLRTSPDSRIHSLPPSSLDSSSRGHQTCSILFNDRETWLNRPNWCSQLIVKRRGKLTKACNSPIWVSKIWILSVKAIRKPSSSPWCQIWQCRRTCSRSQAEESRLTFQIPCSQARNNKWLTSSRPKSSTRCNSNSSGKRSSKTSNNDSKRLCNCSSRLKDSQKGRLTFENLLCLQTHENETLS